MKCAALLMQVFKFFGHLLASDDPLVARDGAMAAWMMSIVGRGDDARLQFLADLTKPRRIPVIGKGAQCI